MDKRKLRTIWLEADRSGNTLAMSIRGEMTLEQCDAVERWIERRRREKTQQK